ncbi:30S ribosomal protein S9 [Patescibacteria group bacterium]|nr:MAG: 30S ribosomal protein S9 [Patescibacteria group bacterium]
MAKGETTKEKGYIEAIGRRKTATARVRLWPASKTTFSVNDRSLLEYFKVPEHRMLTEETFSKAKISQKFKITALVRGGGVAAQAEAVRHGIARALVAFDPELRKKLKKLGFLKRDQRMKERRKFGLKKARKAPQWSKR